MSTGYTFRTLATVADEDTGLNDLVYALVVTTNDLPSAAAEDQDYFLATANATKVVSGGKTVWTVKGINAQGAVETLTLTSNPGTTKGKIYMVSASDETCTLTALTNVSADSTIENGKWNKVIVTASTNSSVLLAKTNVTTNTVEGNTNVTALTLGANDLYDLAEDVNIVYVYGTTLKTADLAAKVPFGAFQAMADDEAQALHTFDGDEYKVYTTNAYGIEVYKNGDKWYKVSDDTETSTKDFVVSDDPVKGVTAKMVDIKVDVNNYVYVLLNDDGVVTDMIVSVESKTDNTLNSIIDDFTFAPAA